MKVLIIGVNGFIGSHISQQNHGRYRLGSLRNGPEGRQTRACAGQAPLPFRRGRYRHQQGMDPNTISEMRCVLPLVAIATPKTYIERPAGRFPARL